ncbi:MAG: hypothetical protein ACREPB_07795 [Arenimonas sp.]
MPSIIKFSPRDVQLEIQDIYGDLLNHLRDGSHPNEDQMGAWMDKLTRIAAVTDSLIIACEDWIDHGRDPYDFEAVKRAVAHAHGQQDYSPRKHR